MVVPPVVTSPLLPCHSMVQPPHWLPMSSALLPATWMCRAVFFRGSARRLFFSSTSDARTHSRAACRCAAEPNVSWSLRSASCERPLSIIPIANLTRRMRTTASSMRDIGTAPSLTLATSRSKNSRYLCGTITMSMPALTETAMACL